ncbi:hypothetical protein H6P81_020423 [Aristolochia fimbriata]|uniref:Uncharacterized protein n=1 Tax=Aristolochia fimbriata TaxID=158543 RepID=A0AAV7DUI3_ARIFI|nr:hypothetical protein H6P81_020423 [Aristolochia fimbriata]
MEKTFGSDGHASKAGVPSDNQPGMDNMQCCLKQYEKDSVKSVILKHEKTFKEQVYELHRLYQTQKLLMKKVKRTSSLDYKSERGNLASETSVHHLFNCPNAQKWPCRTIDLERPADEYVDDEGKDLPLHTEQDTEIELTLGWVFNQRKSASPTSDCSSSVNSSTVDKKSSRSILRIGSKEDIRGHDCRVSGVPDMNISFSSEKDPFMVEGQMRKEKQPPWHVHVLSLNMT